jgi:hypothetical protein
LTLLSQLSLNNIITFRGRLSSPLHCTIQLQRNPEDFLHHGVCDVDEYSLVYNLYDKLGLCSKGHINLSTLRTKTTQLTFFDVNPDKTGIFNIYHDESGTDLEHSRFQLHGALIIQQTKQKQAFQLLHNARNGYEGCVHFVNLRDNTPSLMPSVTAEWIRLYFAQLSEYCFYKCMIVDTRSPAFNQSKFPKPYLLYNHTAMLAVFSGIIWCLKMYGQVTISIFSETVSRSKEDNFISYLPREVVRKSQNSNKCPIVSIVPNSVTLINGNPKIVEPHLKEHCEFIQLTDVLTGAVAQAINTKASQRVKIDLAKIAANCITDSRLPPWKQTKDLHRKFSISCFPDNNGLFYDVNLEVESHNQPKFDGF